MQQQSFQFVMPGFMPGIHAFLYFTKQGVDGRDKPGHDADGPLAKSNHTLKICA
jgi:hypothetical protein